MKNCAVILAGGKGTRMKSEGPKAMCEVLFKPMLDWVIDAVVGADVDEVCVVTGFSAETIENHLPDTISTVRQEQQLGTGHAVMQALPFIETCGADNVIVLNGDAPFIDTDTIQKALKYHIRKDYGVTVVTSEVEDPTGYGRIIRDQQDDIEEIIEEKNADEETKRIREVNSGVFCFKANSLVRALNVLTPDPVKGEYYLTDTLKLIISFGERAGAFLADSADTVLGANTRVQLGALNEIARNRILEKLMLDGVDVPCRDGVIVGPDVTVGPDTRILPGTILCGKVSVGAGCVLGPNSFVQNAEIGNGVTFNNAQIRQARILDGATVGPFVQIRPDSVIGERVHLGNFVEVKNSVIDSDTAVSHLTYVGDSDVGKHVNFGCGTVTVNFTGKKKYRTTIRDGAFIGCNTNLIAPVTVGENAFTAAGSTITEDVPDNALAVARDRQVNKEGWVIRRQPYRRKI